MVVNGDLMMIVIIRVMGVVAIRVVVVVIMMMVMIVTVMMVAVIVKVMVGIFSMTLKCPSIQPCLHLFTYLNITKYLHHARGRGPFYGAPYMVCWGETTI